MKSALIVDDLDAAGIRHPGPAVNHDIEASPRRSGLQVIKLAAEHHPTVIDDGYVLADVLHQIELMAGKDDRGAPVGKVSQDAGHLHHCQGIEALERFGEDQHHRVVNERHSQLHPLLIAVGKVVDLVVRPLGQP